MKKKYEDYYIILRERKLRNVYVRKRVKTKNKHQSSFCLLLFGPFTKNPSNKEANQQTNKQTNNSWIIPHISEVAKERGRNV